MSSKDRTSRFDRLFEKLIRIEGGYANHPDDRGAETYCGISRRFWPQWEGWTVVDRLKSSPGFPKSAYENAELAQNVKEFYRQNFWSRMRLDIIDEEAICEEIFEMSVNLGISKTAEIIRASYANLDPAPGPDPGFSVEVRVLFPKDAEALNRISAAGRTDAFLVLANAYQAVHYNNLVFKDKRQKIFLLGWLRNRCVLPTEQRGRKP